MRAWFFLPLLIGCGGAETYQQTAAELTDISIDDEFEGGVPECPDCVIEMDSQLELRGRPSGGGWIAVYYAGRDNLKTIRYPVKPTYREWRQITPLPGPIWGAWFISLSGTRVPYAVCTGSLRQCRATSPTLAGSSTVTVH